MFLLVPAHPGFPGQIPQSRKMVVCVVCVISLGYCQLKALVIVFEWIMKCMREMKCLQCFDAVGWAAGRASGL